MWKGSKLSTAEAEWVRGAEIFTGFLSDSVCIIQQSNLSYQTIS